MYLLRILGSVGFACTSSWSFENAFPLFTHKGLKTLDLHYARVEEHDSTYLPSQIVGKSVTALETLNLIDCDFCPVVLSWMLGFPRKLRYLSIGSDVDNADIFDHSLVDHGDHFRAISDSGHRLEGFRFSFTNWQIVPAPGLHEPSTIRFLETSEDHLERQVTEAGDEYPLPDIECPVEELLPPNLEVLKISQIVTKSSP